MKWFLRVTRMKARSPAGRPAQLLLRCGRDGKGGLIAASPNRSRHRRLGHNPIVCQVIIATRG
jgi:hypothetical protein